MKDTHKECPNHWSPGNSEELLKSHPTEHLLYAKNCSRCWGKTRNKAGKLPALLEFTFLKETNSNYNK